MDKTYRIVRFYFRGGHRKVGIGGLTLDEAQAYCRREDTHASTRVCWEHGGVVRAERCLKCGGETVRTWFDGYEEE